jgi:hypothetical protein
MSLTEEARDHLVGAVEWLDVRKRSLGMLGVEVDWSRVEGELDPEREGIVPGTILKTKGRFDAGVFTAQLLRVLPRPAILVEAIRARIDTLDARRGRLVVAGVPVETSSETRIDRLDKR